MGNDTGCSIAVLVVFAALAVLLAILGDSVLTGALVFAGILLVMHGSNRAAGGRAAQGWTEIVAGVGATAVAMWLSGMGGRWWWLPVWLFLGYVVLFNGNKARLTDRRHGDSLIAFGVLLMIFSVLAPLWVYPSLASEAPESAVGFSVSDGLGAAWDLVGTVVTSLWGWLNLLFVVFIGVAMWRRHGAWVLPALVLAAAFVVGGFSSSAGADLAAAAGHSPASWMKSLVLASDDHWGTAGWGILLLGLGLVAFAAPLLRKLLAINRVVMAAEVVKLREGDEASLRYMVERGCGPGTMMLVLSAFQGLIVGIGIALWVGLRWAAGDGRGAALRSLPHPRSRGAELQAGLAALVLRPGRGGGCVGRPRQPHHGASAGLGARAGADQPRVADRDRRHRGFSRSRWCLPDEPVGDLDAGRPGADTGRARRTRGERRGTRCGLDARVSGGAAKLADDD